MYYCPRLTIVKMQEVRSVSPWSDWFPLALQECQWLSSNCAASHCLACPPAAGRVVKVLSAFVLPPQPAAAAAGARQGLVSPPSCTCTPAIVTVLPFHHPAGGFKCHRLVNDITCYMVWCMQVVSNKFGSGNDINYNQTFHKSEKRCKKWTKSKENGIR